MVRQTWCLIRFSRVPDESSLNDYNSKPNNFVGIACRLPYLLFLARESANRMLERALPNGTRDFNMRIRSTAPRQYFKYLSKGQNPVESHCTQNISYMHLTISIPTKPEKVIHRPGALLCLPVELHEAILGYVLEFDLPGFTTMESCGNIYACA